MENIVRAIFKQLLWKIYKITKKYCDNFYYTEKLSDDDCAVHSPRISPDGNYLVWLQRKAGAVPHHNAHALVLRDLRLEENQVK